MKYQNLKKYFIVPFVFFATGFAQAFDYIQLEKLIKENKLKTISDTIEKLPLSYKSKYVLIFKSRSLHGSSFENPRVLLYGEDASFILSFNGSPEQKGYLGLETMEYDQSTSEFKYREILFPNEKESQSPSSVVRFSDDNPEKCLKCHGQTPRPIWDTHPLWPGVYGENYLTDLSFAERSGLNKFLAIQGSHPRYKHLRNINIFTEKNTFKPDVAARYTNFMKDSPVVELSKYLAKYNIQKIVGQMKRSPEFEKFQFLYLASLSQDCGSFESFLPDGVRPTVVKDLELFSVDTFVKNKKQDLLKKGRALTVNQNLFANQILQNKALDQFRFIVEQSLNISTDFWTMALEADTYDYTQPDSVELALEKELIHQIGKSDEKLKNLVSLRAVGSTVKYCEYLRKNISPNLAQGLKKGSGLSTAQSLQKIYSEEKIRTVAEADPVPGLLNLCASCHQGVVGPALPFLDKDRMSTLLNQGNYPRGTLLQEILYRLSPKAGPNQMPRGLNLSESQIQVLEDYFQNLSEKK